MGKLGLVVTIALALVAVSLLPVAMHASAALDVETGDFWKYEMSAAEEGLSITGTMTLKVSRTEGSGVNEVYDIKMTGSGDYSGSFSGYSVSGKVDFSGATQRLKSNFSMVSDSMKMDMTMKMLGVSATYEFGTLQTFSPALDDYIGDSNPGHGATLVSRSTVTTTTWMDMEVMGVHENDTDSSTDTAVGTIQIAASNETVTVPAGTFECYKYTYTLTVGYDMETLTYFYSDKVGNYVKMQGSGDVMGAFNNASLKSYSFAGKGTGGGISSLFSGTNLVIIVLIVIVAVVLLLVLMVMRGGRKMAPQMMMPPPEMGIPPPPPPQPPPPGSGM